MGSKRTLTVSTSYFECFYLRPMNSIIINTYKHISPKYLSQWWPTIRMRKVLCSEKYREILTWNLVLPDISSNILNGLGVQFWIICHCCWANNFANSRWGQRQQQQMGLGGDVKPPPPWNRSQRQRQVKPVSWKTLSTLTPLIFLSAVSSPSLSRTIDDWPKAIDSWEKVKWQWELRGENVVCCQDWSPSLSWGETK